MVGIQIGKALRPNRPHPAARAARARASDRTPRARGPAPAHRPRRRAAEREPGALHPARERPLAVHAERGLRTGRSRRQRSRPSALIRSSSASSQTASQTIGPGARQRSTSPRGRGPTHGARSTANHAVRSPRCSSAQISMTTSRTAGRSCSGSISTARNAMPRLRSVLAMSRAWARARTRTAIRHSGCWRRRASINSATASCFGCARLRSRECRRRGSGDTGRSAAG